MYTLDSDKSIKSKTPTLCSSLIDWMCMTEEQVFNKFASLPNAVVINENLPFEFRSIYIKGSRKDSVILCAHLDTVWNDGVKKENIGSTDDFIYSSNKKRGFNEKSEQAYSSGIGIGADDRAGLSMIWSLRDLGHSILITCGEESGCLGALALSSNKTLLENISNENQFIIAFDRRLFQQAVFYNVATEDFIEYVCDNTGFSSEPGGGSDICILCKHICGVNLSVGYKNEHTHNEVLVIPWWIDTYNAVTKWLSQEDIPRYDFTYIEEDEVE